MKDGKGKEGERKTPTSLYCRDTFLFIFILFSTSPSLFIVIYYYYFIIFLFVHIGVCSARSSFIHPPLPRYPDSAPPVQLLQRASVVRYPPGKFVDCIRAFAWKFKRGTTSAEQPSPPSTKDPDPFSLYIFFCGEGR